MKRRWGLSMVWNHSANQLLRFSCKLVHRDNLNAVLWILQKCSWPIRSTCASADTLANIRDILHSRQLDWNHIDSILNKWNVFGKLNRRLFPFSLLRRLFSFSARRRDISKQHLPVQRNILRWRTSWVRENWSDGFWCAFLMQILPSFYRFWLEDFGSADFDWPWMFWRQLDVRCWLIPLLLVKYYKVCARIYE